MGNNGASGKTAKNQTQENGNAKAQESAKVTNGEGSKVNVNGTNGTAEVTLRNKKTRVNEDGGRTTMVVRLHPGQTNRLSAYVEDQDSPSRRSWLAEVQPGDTASICGLEISFSSVPQDIDIKVIPGDSLEEDGADQIVQDENKTRE